MFLMPGGFAFTLKVGGAHAFIPSIHFNQGKSQPKCMQKQEVKRQEVEELLGFAITDEQLQEALECARRKQEYIYQLERRPVVLQHWYLVKLTEEYVRSLSATTSMTVHL